MKALITKHSETEREIRFNKGIEDAPKGLPSVEKILFPIEVQRFTKETIQQVQKILRLFI